MKVFIAYKASGEVEAQLIDNLQIMSDALHAAGVESYSTHLQQQEAAPSGQKMKSAFLKLDECDAVLAFVQNEEKSEGMILEIGYAYGKKPIHVFAKRGVHMSSFELADSVSEWDDVEQLTQLIKELFNA